jgi:hypothetical protein
MAKSVWWSLLNQIGEMGRARKVVFSSTHPTTHASSWYAILIVPTSEADHFVQLYARRFSCIVSTVGGLGERVTLANNRLRIKIEGTKERELPISRSGKLHLIFSIVWRRERDSDA